MSFIDFAAQADSQMDMWQRTGLLPAIASIEAGDDKVLNTFLEQLRSTFPVPLSEHLSAIVELGDQVYHAVLEEGIEPQQALAEMVNEFQKIIPESAEGDQSEATPQSDEGGE